MHFKILIGLAILFNLCFKSSYIRSLVGYKVGIVLSGWEYFYILFKRFYAPNFFIYLPSSYFFWLTVDCFIFYRVSEFTTSQKKKGRRKGKFVIAFVSCRGCWKFWKYPFSWCLYRYKGFIVAPAALPDVQLVAKNVNANAVKQQLANTHTHKGGQVCVLAKLKLA